MWFLTCKDILGSSAIEADWFKYEDENDIIEALNLEKDKTNISWNLYPKFGHIINKDGNWVEFNFFEI